MIYNVSPHLLMDVRSCGMRGWTRHVMGYTTFGDAIKAKAGSAYHAGMAVYLDPDIVEQGPERRARALKTLHAVYDPTWETAPADQLDEAYTPKNLEKLFDRWMTLYPPHAQPWKRVLNVETAFVSRAWAVEQGSGSVYDFTLLPIPARPTEYGDRDIVQLILRPDALVEDPAGFVRYVDTKTTGWHITDPGWARSLRMNLQTQLYADGVVQKYGEKAVYGGWINACEIKKLPSDMKRKCSSHPGMTYAECGVEHAKTHIMSCDTTPERVSKALAEATRAATTFVKLQIQHREHAPRDDDQGKVLADLTDARWKAYPIESIPNEGSSNDKCRWCPASGFCDEANNVIGAIPSYMKHEPWPVNPDKREHPE